MDEKNVKRIFNPGIPEALHPEIGNGAALAGNTHEFLLRSPDPSKTLEEHLSIASSVGPLNKSTTSIPPAPLTNEPSPSLESTVDIGTESIDNETISNEHPQSIAIPPMDTESTPIEGNTVKSKKKGKKRKKEMLDSGLTGDAPENYPSEEKSAKAGKLIRKAAKSVKRMEDSKVQPDYQEYTSSETSLSPYTKWLKSLAGSEYVHPYEDDFALAQGGGPTGEGISETFADLLAGQGYKEQAIEMYMKLMEKYPEKSGFFAAKIEALQ